MPILVLVALLVALQPSVACAGAPPEIPDPALTPGAATDLTLAEICARKWGRDARKVTARMKQQVLAGYRMSATSCRPDGHGRRLEIDHLISRELGGADHVGNLWPQCYAGRWNAAMKDRLENRLHREACAGRLTLPEARALIVSDWRVAWRRYFGPCR